MFRLTKPEIIHKEKAIIYINELLQNKSPIHGTGFLDRYLENSTYEEWLKEIECQKTSTDKDIVPASTYFLMDIDDNIIGMTNIRHTLNKKLYFHGGNIGYSIRPTQRGKGYGKIILYLALEKCKNLGLKQVLITAEDTNIPSYKTIEALGGILENKVLDKNKNKYFRRYWINVDKSLIKYNN